MSHLGQTMCIVPLNSSQNKQDGIECTKAKEYLAKVLLSTLYTQILCYQVSILSQSGFFAESAFLVALTQFGIFFLRETTAGYRGKASSKTCMTSLGMEFSRKCLAKHDILAKTWHLKSDIHFFFISFQVTTKMLTQMIKAYRCRKRC